MVHIDGHVVILLSVTMYVAGPPFFFWEEQVTIQVTRVCY